MTTEHFDVLIVGAGLSGIGAACHLQADAPGKSFTILEARDAVGGTWDLFRYPGIRSDSDMYTLGYSFRPWPSARSIADGPAILDYIKDTAREHGVEDKIRLRHRVVRAEWSTPDARWTVDVERTDTGDTLRFTCGFLFMCAGYYRYDEGYTPEFAGTDRFAGQIVHPQHWPEDLDYAGKRVVVVGSGATAVTLVPAMAEKAAHVTMLQRSPTYVVALPAEDPLAKRLRRFLPAKMAYPVLRWKNVLLSMLSFQREPPPAALDEGADPQGAGAAAAAGLRHRHALQAALQPVGPAAVPGPGRRPLPGPRQGNGLDRHRPDRDVHREGAAARVRRRSSRPTSSSRRPGSTCSPSAACPSRSTDHRSRSPRPSATRE